MVIRSTHIRKGEQPGGCNSLVKVKDKRLIIGPLIKRHQRDENQVVTRHLHIPMHWPCICRYRQRLVWGS
jgi:hypothetical protein